MDGTRRKVSLGFTPERVAEGQHICYIYNDDAERLRVMARYMEAGLAENEKLLYLAGTMTPHEIICCLAELGVDARSNPRQFTVAGAGAAYCPTGVFDPAEMLEVIGEFYLGAIDEGYSGARGTGEMSWSLVEGRTSVEDVMVYEAGLTNLVLEHPYTACCQYDVRRFAGETIMDVLSIHPMMIVRGQLVKNPFFVPPAVFLKEYRERRFASASV